MFNLIKKDFITSIKFKGVLYLILITIIIGFVLPGTALVATKLLPIAVGYLSLMNAFYYDNLNKSTEFMLSIPTKREDIVYSRYLFALIMILIGLMVTQLILGGIIFEFANFLVFRDVAFSTVVMFLSFSVIIPAIYKFGYGKMRIISPIILFGVYFITIYLFRPIETKLELIQQYGYSSITLTGASVSQNYSKYLTMIVDSINIEYVNYTTITLFTLGIFTLSMLLSMKIFNNKGAF